MQNLIDAGLRLSISALVMAMLAGLLGEYALSAFWPTFKTTLHVIVTGEIIVVALLVLSANVLKNADGRGSRIHEASEVDPADTRNLAGSDSGVASYVSDEIPARRRHRSSPDQQ